VPVLLAVVLAVSVFAHMPISMSLLWFVSMSTFVSVCMSDSLCICTTGDLFK